MSQSEVRQAKKMKVSKMGSSVMYPLPYPSSAMAQWKLKQKLSSSPSFLTPEHGELFNIALRTSYLGFISESDMTEHCLDKMKEDENKKLIQQRRHDLHVALDSLYLRDITQPFGLGTPCAKTFVTRCLVGDYGSTYRYLGMRMFSHPWDYNENQAIKAYGANSSIWKGIKTIKALDFELTTKTEKHMIDLSNKRKDMIIDPSKIGYTVSLINRAEPFDLKENSSLKFEPSFNKDRCSVSWHADSSLVHGSTIAVYQTVVETKKQQNQQQQQLSNDDHPFEETKSSQRQKRDSQNKQTSSSSTSSTEYVPWKVALRVSHDAEGPTASNLKVSKTTKTASSTSFRKNSKNEKRDECEDNEDEKEEEEEEELAPPIAIELPNDRSYFLLGDFNHHHQHAVLSAQPFEAGVRYSSTHRLLREGNNVLSILKQCENACSNFHKKSLKQFRSEQLLLTELECEWLHQFYIQGNKHKELLWPHWEEPITQLLKYWQLLENRTKIISNLLINAGHYGHHSNDKKIIKKQRKSFQTISDILDRHNESDQVRKDNKNEKQHQNKIKKINHHTSSSSSSSSSKALEMLYDPFASLLQERLDKRHGWELRRKDGVFHSLPIEDRPLDWGYMLYSPSSSLKDSTMELSYIENLEQEISKIKKSGNLYAKLPSPPPPRASTTLESFSSGPRSNMPSSVLDNISAIMGSESVGEGAMDSQITPLALGVHQSKKRKKKKKVPGPNLNVKDVVPQKKRRY